MHWIYLKKAMKVIYNTTKAEGLGNLFKNIGEALSKAKRKPALKIKKYLARAKETGTNLEMQL